MCSSLVPVVSQNEGQPARCLSFLHLCGRGVNHPNLRQLDWPLRMDNTPAPVFFQMALVNARSLASKTFILKFTGHKVKPPSLAQPCRSINSSTAAQFFSFLFCNLPQRFCVPSLRC
ncbi:hypothetical protein XENORESO_020688 [Xenotaenia resolanae]|uniref:Uncharacterized protein n=1 Tax=Xenotaenia resolanae TaxID=208358 RepID=A0ABV0WIM1_9TELE